MGTAFAVVNLAESLNSPFGRDGTSMNVTPGLCGYVAVRSYVDTSECPDWCGVLISRIDFRGVPNN